MMYLTEHQKDVLISIFEGAVTQASHLLKEMIGQDGRVMLEAPHAKLVTPEDLAQLQKKDTASDQFDGTGMDFSGPFCGRALLICRSSDSDSLVKLMFGVLPDEFPQGLAAEAKTDALCELGNILLNACMARFAHLFGAEIRTQTPKPVVGPCLEVIQGGRSEQNRRMLYVPVRFKKAFEEVRIGFVLDTISVHALMICLESFVEKNKFENPAVFDKVEGL